MNGVYTAINPKAGLRNTYDALNAMKQLEAAGLTNKAQMIKNDLANGRNTLLPDLGQDDILRAYFQTKPRGTW